MGRPSHQTPTLAIPTRKPYLYRCVYINCVNTLPPYQRFCLRQTVTSNSHHPKPPPTSNRHSYVDRRDPPEPPGSHRRRPGPDRGRASRVGVHSRQPAIRLPRVEARGVRPPRTLARGAARVDQGRRRAGFLHARSVGLESAPELFRRAVVLGVLCP